MPDDKYRISELIKERVNASVYLCICGNEDARLTKSGNARSEQLLVMPTEQLTDREWLPGEHLNLSRRQLLEGKVTGTEQLKGDYMSLLRKQRSKAR